LTATLGVLWDRYTVSRLCKKITDLLTPRASAPFSWAVVLWLDALT